MNYRIKFGGFYYDPDTPAVVDELGRDIAFAIEIPRYIFNAVIEELGVDPDDELDIANRFTTCLNSTMFSILITHPEDGVYIDLRSLTIGVGEVPDYMERYISAIRC